VSRTAPDNRRWRWRLAILLDRIPGMCWADLVTWALGWRRNPWARRTSACRADEARSGCCYCGKYGPESPRELAKRPQSRWRPPVKPTNPGGRRCPQ